MRQSHPVNSAQTQLRLIIDSPMFRVSGGKSGVGLGE